MRYILVTFFVFLLSNVNAYDSLVNKLKILKDYTENVEPTYIIGSDTFVIAKISRPPDSINSIFYYCKNNNIIEAYKYVFLPILKLKLTYGRFDYDFCNYYNNGIIDLALYAMGIEYEYLSVDCAFTKTHDIYLWLLKHKEIYRGYKPMEIYMKEVRKRLRDNKKQFKSQEQGGS